MADLETAADTALLKVKEFTAEVGKAHDAFAAAEEQLSRVAAQVEADWSALSEAAAGLLAKAETEKRRMSEESRQALQALSDLKEGMTTAASQGETEIEETSQEVSALGDQVEAAQAPVESMAEQVETAVQGLKERAAEIETALEEALANAREFVGVEVVNQLGELQEEIEEGAEALKTALTDTCQQALDEVKTAWETQLEQVEQTVAEAFEQAGEHAHVAVEEALRACVEGHQEAFEEVAQSVATLEAALDKLKSAVEAREADAEGAKDVLAEGMGETSARLTSALAALQSVKELLASFTFVEM